MPDRSASAGPARVFPTTLWTTVEKAGDPARSSSDEALEQLCRNYWQPVCAFIRRTGADPHQAEDLAQAFFAHLLKTQALGRVRREGGRFRSWLLGVLKHFLSHERDKAGAQKRGGGRELISIDAQESGFRNVLEPKDVESPDRQFDRDWALSLLEQVLRQIEAEHSQAGKSDQFRELHPFLSGSDPAIPYAEAARRLGISEGSVKVQVHRMRQRFGDLLRAAVAGTVADPALVDDELRALIELAAARL